MSTPNELFDYVQLADNSFQWECVSARSLAGGILCELHLVSQTWQGDAWRHRLSVFLPDNAQHSDWVFLTIGSDSPEDRGFTHVDTELGATLRVACAYLYDVPNQPLFGNLCEDELLAHSLTEYLDTGDPTWPLLFPMVKSAVRAMDAITALLAEQGRPTPKRFALHGASKRGWTSWLSAVLDRRVAAILPEVYDNLNLFAQMPHQVKMWAAYSEMIHDYTDQRLQDKMRTPRGHHLAQLIDPYTYRAELALPKLLIHGANDRYWATDALNLYWDDLPGDKCILYEPNQGHHIHTRSRVTATVRAFLEAVFAGASLPKVTAAYREEPDRLEVTLQCAMPAATARIWVAHAANQDFREASWSARDMKGRPDGQEFTGVVERPAAGNAALIAECELAADSGSYVLSAPVRIVTSTLS